MLQYSVQHIGPFLAYTHIPGNRFVHNTESWEINLGRNLMDIWDNGMRKSKNLQGKYLLTESSATTKHIRLITSNDSNMYCIENIYYNDIIVDINKELSVVADSMLKIRYETTCSYNNLWFTRNRDNIYLCHRKQLDPGETNSYVSSDTVNFGRFLGRSFKIL